MKIAIYNVTIANVQGGIETYCWEISKKLKENGHHVTLISGEGDFIKYKDTDISLFKYTKKENFINLGTRFIKLCMRMSFLKNSFSYLKQENFEIFIITKPFDFIATYIMKKYLKKKSIFIFRSGGEDFFAFDRFFSKSCDLMFSVSKENTKKVKDRYSRDVKLIHNGVDVNKFHKASTSLKKSLIYKYNLTNKKIILSAGRVVGWKGFQLVIKAMNKLSRWHYILVGDGAYLKTLKDLAEKLNVQDRVLFLGYVENINLIKYLSIADIFIQPSIGAEGFPNTILEAMACNLPVIASDVGGIPDILKDDKNGYLFKKDDVNDMINKIKLGYKNKDRLSKNARQTVEDSFTWEHNADKLISMINDFKEKQK